MATVPNLTSANFLSDAAHLLREAAPETSAHLMTECAHHLSRQKIAISDTYRQHVCTACGYIMLPGYDTQMELNSAKRKRKKKQTSVQRRNAPRAGPCKTLTCGLCQSITRIQLPAPEKVARSKVSKTKPEITKESLMENPKPKLAVNASSKKRAKSRKAGLQALLSSQQKQKASNGLSLASFMK